MYHDKRSNKGTFARSAHPSKDALRKRRARAALKAGRAPVAARTPARASSARIAAADGTRPSAAQVALLTTQRFSFAPSYIRKGDVKGDGSIAPNARNPSRRRFATEAEARTHAERFAVKRGHLGSFVTRINERPTSWVNAATGRTNEVA